jgi:hypothetical protein
VDRTRRRSLIAVIAGAAAGLILIGANLAFTQLPSSPGPGPTGPPPLVIEWLGDGASAELNFYNYTLIGSWTNVDLGQVSFELASPDGKWVVGPPDSGIDEVAKKGTVVATFSFVGPGSSYAGAQTYGPGYGAGTPLSDQDWFSVFDEVRDALSGYSLTVFTPLGTVLAPIT